MRDDRYRMRMVLAEWAAHDRTRRRLEKEIEDCIDELEAVADPKTPALTGMPEIREITSARASRLLKSFLRMLFFIIKSPSNRDQRQ